MPAKIGEAIFVDRRLKAVHGLRQHKGQCVFARTLRSRKDDSVRKAIARQHVAHAMDGFGISYKIGEGHERRV